MSDKIQQAIADEVLIALESNSLDLPTLPEMANKVRKLIDDPNVSANELIQVLSADPAISAHIIKAANSAAASGGTYVDTLRGAVSRLGYRMLHNLVMTITMSKLFKADNPSINQKLKRLWEHSRCVAANSFVIAQRHKHLKPEQAMLAGLVHNLGALPLLTYADRRHPHLDQATLDELVRRYGSRVGTRLLQSWNFSNELIEVIAGYENLQRDNGSALADYVDVVTLANLQKPGIAKFVAWQNVSAAKKLGFSETECLSFLADHAEQISIAQEMLGIQAAKPQPTLKANDAESKPLALPNQKTKSGLLYRLLGLFK